MDSLCERLKSLKDEDLDIEIEDDNKLDYQTLQDNQKEVIRKLKLEDQF